MHLFESQLISTVKATEADDQHITFVGHYRHGDGFSLPLAGAVMTGGCVVLMYAVGVHSILLGLALVFLAPTLALLLYEKKLLFNLETRELHIRTRAIWGTKEDVLPFDDLKLQSEKIFIRLADNCGALDLILPDGLIRLIVDGKYEWTLEKAERLSGQTGIPLQRTGSAPPRT